MECVIEEKTLKKRARKVSASVIDDISICMAESVERQKESDAKQMELEERRLNLNLYSSRKEGKRFIRAQRVVERIRNMAERKIALDKKNFVLKHLEKKNQADENAKNERIEKERRTKIMKLLEKRYKL